MGTGITITTGKPKPIPSLFEKTLDAPDRATGKKNREAE